jgi:uncharacterized membrane protein (DUF106 family)
MAAPGGQQSPENMPMPDMKGMWTMLIMMMMIMVLYWIDGSEHVIGKLLNYVFQFLDFNGEWPVVTLMLAGTVMIVISTIIRTLMMDTISQQKSQAYSTAFNKELRQARLDNNTYKLKKLMEMQPMVMAKTMESSNKMMKTMPVTMIIVIPMFLWVRYFVSVTMNGMSLISVPWSMISAGAGVDLNAVYVLPAWILIYSLISIPIGQIVMRLVRTYQFRRRLAEIEAEESAEEVA